MIRHAATGKELLTIEQRVNKAFMKVKSDRSFTEEQEKWLELIGRHLTKTLLMEKEEDKLKLFEKCPICGGEIVEKEVEKVLRGGSNTAIMVVMAEVCLHCGERLYTPETVFRFDDIRKKLSEEHVSEFEPIGKTYQVA